MPCFLGTHCCGPNVLQFVHTAQRDIQKFIEPVYILKSWGFVKEFAG